MAYNWEGILVCYCVATHTTVDGDRYAYFLHEKLHPQIYKVRRVLLQAGIMILLDNIRPRHKDCFICIRRIWLGNIATHSVRSQYESSGLRLVSEAQGITH